MPKCKKYIVELENHEFIEVFAASKKHVKEKIQEVILRIYEQLSFDF